MVLLEGDHRHPSMVISVIAAIHWKCSRYCSCARLFSCIVQELRELRPFFGLTDVLGAPRIFESVGYHVANAIARSDLFQGCSADSIIIFPPNLTGVNVLCCVRPIRVWYPATRSTLLNCSDEVGGARPKGSRLTARKLSPCLSLSALERGFCQWTGRSLTE